MGRVERRLRTFANPAELARGACEEVFRIASDSIGQRGRFRVALSGGSTPDALYRQIAASQDARGFPSWHVFWGDERLVPRDHAESNYRRAFESFLSKVPIPVDHVHPVPVRSDDPGAAAAAYERTLRDAFEGERTPRLDLVLLGLGEDGHTASLFPGGPALREARLLVAPVPAGRSAVPRVTLTFPAINAARAVRFLVAGAKKAEVLRRVLEGAEPVEALPAKGISPSDGTLLWMVDRAAAGRLSGAAG